MVTRRGFLRSLFGAIADGPMVHKPGPEQAQQAPQVTCRKVYLADVSLAGFGFHEGMRPEVMAGLSVGQDPQVRCEPDNPYDANALAVNDRAGHHRGYIPRWANSLPALLADQAVDLGAEISVLQHDAEPWERVRIRIYQRLWAETYARTD